ncbi:MAG: hypothetical protein ACRD1J_04595 [Terriglobia bacterium]
MRKSISVVIICLAVAVIVLAIEVTSLRRSDDPPNFNSTYEAVLLDNGQVYYGKLSRMGTSYPEMTSVYYIVRTEDPATKQVKHVLVKRGKELHGPTETFFNVRHIIMVEPVSPNSEVARLIAQSEAQPQK